MEEDYVQLVSELNEIYLLEVDEPGCGEILDEYGCMFTYLSDGCNDLIMFNDICIWNSDNDDRGYEEEAPWDYKETVEEYVIRKYERLVKLLAGKIHES